MINVYISICTCWLFNIRLSVDWAVPDLRAIEAEVATVQL